MAVLICASSYGEELPDLIAKLQKLEGNELIRGVVHIEDCTFEKEDKGSQQLEKADLTITADVNLLTLTVMEGISNTRIFRDFSLLRGSEIVNYGPSLAQELAGLELVERLPDSHEGIQCSRWRLQFEEKGSKLGMGGSVRRDVELWIDPDGYPLAASFKTQTKSKVLVIKMSTESTREHRYERLGGRLIIVFEKDETSRKMKSDGGKRIVTTTVEVKKD